VSILAALNAKTLELRKGRDELAGSFQAVQALATANAKDRVIKAGGDLSTVTVEEADAVSAIQKAIKQVRDTLSLVPTDAKSLRELEILESLMPKQPSEDELRGEAESFAAGLEVKSMKQMGALMAHLASVFGVALDKSKASSVAKSVLST